MTQKNGSALTGMRRAGGRNSAVELCRFLFCLEIMLWHSRKLAPEGTELILCGKHGYIGVEFFFFVTGWLIAARATRDEWNKMENKKGGGVLSDTKNFFLGKIRAILPFTVFAYTFSYIRFIVIKGLNTKELIVSMLKALWEMCLLQISGVIMGSSIVSGIWYVSAMLIAGTVVYILRRKFRGWFSFVIAPLAYILISGWMFQNYSNLNLNINKFAIVPLGLPRAFIELSLGCFLYEMSDRLHRIDLTLLGRACVTFVTGAGILFVFYSTTIGFDGIKRIEYIMAPVLAMSVMLLFSEQGLFFLHRSQMLDRVLLFLGRLSLPIYLNHICIRQVIQTRGWHYWQALAAVIACTFVVSIVCLWSLFLWGLFWKAYGARVKRCFIKEKAG